MSDACDGRRAALVTGGATGIGLACCEALATSGYDVAFAGRREAVVREAEAALSSTHPDARIVGHVADVSDVVAARGLVDAVASDFGRIDALVTAAAVSLGSPLLDAEPAEWELTFGCGVLGAAACATAAASHMRRRGYGRIVLIGSIQGIQSDATGGAAYSADKAAIGGLGRSLAVELAADGITANVVAPGWVLTAMTEPYMPEDGDLRAINPLGRVGRAEEIADVVRYIATDAPEFLTGATIYVDGGQVARAPVS
jgi:3-oxoacyl-[acyl-carrier protein] reductase